MKMYDYSETKPERSGKYLARMGSGSGAYYMTVPYSKVHDAWNANDWDAQKEIDEYSFDNVTAWGHLEDLEKEDKKMEQKLIDYIENYYNLKFEHRLLQERFNAIKEQNESLVYNQVKTVLSYSDHLTQWEYDSLLRNGISNEKADEIVKVIIAKRKAEKEAEADEN